MFQKENCSVQSTGGDKKGAKKAKDVPLRKSDRRSLLQQALRVLSLTTSDNDNNGDDAPNKGDDARHLLLQAAFLEGSLVSRQIQLPDARATLYIRSPSGSTSSSSSDSDDPWPYRGSPQCIWMQLDSKTLFSDADKAVLIDLPTVALLSVLTGSSLASAASETSQLLLPTVVVPHQVSKYLCRGADLMRAGMREIQIPTTTISTTSAQQHAVQKVKSPFVSDYQQRVVAVTVQGNPKPFAVGILAPDLFKSMNDNSGVPLNMSVGTQGVGVMIVTCYGDDLWRKQKPYYRISSSGVESPSNDSGALCHDYDDGNYGNSGFLQGRLVLPIVELEDDEEGVEDDEEGVEDETGDLLGAVAEESDETEASTNVHTSNTDEAANVICDPSATLSNETESVQQQQEEHACHEEEEPQASATITLTPEEVLHAAVCRALVTISPKKDLPMLISNFYAQYVIPSRPPDTTIELKRTRYKKFGNYIAEQVDSGLLTVGPDASTKDPSSVLIGYNRRHPDLCDYIAQEKASPTLSSDPDSRRLVLTDLYCLPSHFQSLLRLDPDVVKAVNASSDERKGTGLLTAREMRTILDDYIAWEELVDPTQPHMVVLDGPLTDALFGKGKKQQQSGFIPERLARKDLVTAWTDKMEIAFALVEVPGNRIVRLARGRPPVVCIEVEKRQSRKFVTRVRGLEHFGLDADAVRKEVSLRFACSGSADESPERRAALPTGHVELVFQGNLVDELEALLLGDDSLTSHGGAKKSPYRLPKNAIEVVLRKGVPARRNKPTPKKQK